MNVRSLPLMTALIAAAGLCGAVLLARQTGPAQAPVMTPAEPFAAASLTDWVSTADAVVAAEVVDSPQPAPTATIAGDDSGITLVGRRVEVRVIDGLWRRDGGRGVPSTVGIDGLAWAEVDGRRMPVGDGGGRTMDVGDRYVMPVVWVADEERWAPLSTRAILPLDGDTVTAPADADAAVRALAGPVHSVADKLRAVPAPDRDAAGDAVRSTTTVPDDAGTTVVTLP